VRRTLPILFLLAACAGDPGPGAPVPDDGNKDILTPALRGQVVRQEDLTGYGPVLVALQEAKTRHVVALTTTDDEGNFLFEELDVTPHVPVVYDNRRGVFHLPESHYTAGPNEVVDVRIEMIPEAGVLAATGVPLQGRVTDAATGDPIFGAIVETTSIQESVRTLFSELEGRSNRLTQPTDADGRYRIDHMPVFTLNNLEVVPHVRVSAPGYRSQSSGGWNRDLFPGQLNVQLERGEDQGVIEGRLVHLRTGEPVAGLDVTVEWRNGGGAFPKTLLGAIGTSDAEGRFRIEGLPAGGHLLNPAFPLDDGWSGEQNRTVTVPAAGPVDVGTLRVVEAMRVIAPADREIVEDQLLLRWEPVEGAVFYVVEFFRAEDGARFETGTEEAVWKPGAEDGEEFFAVDGTYLWSIIAFSDPINEAGRPERARVFRLGKP